MSIRDDDIAEILKGLSQTQKSLSPKYLYDERGSQLFDDITRLPEYYLTETEIQIMFDNLDEISALVGPLASLIEFGSGSSLKTRILLEYLNHLAAYVPVDISEEHLLASAGQIQSEFPHIEVLPVVADFTQEFDLPNPAIMPLRNIVYFPGSTIGNFEREVAINLLRVMHSEAKEGGALLIGADLQKDTATIEAAYNDSAGVTAAFNLNVLNHLNETYGADFDIDAFVHDARYDEKEGRVAIRLVSTRDQQVTLGGETLQLANGEGILTEYSHKYTKESFAKMAESVGFEVKRVWTDADELFSLQYCTRA